jgi:hypothetical protein
MVHSPRRALGDWLEDRTRFPHATASAIHDRGLFPGIRIEPEHVGRDAAAFHQTAYLLHRDSQPLTLDIRRAWDRSWHISTRSSAAWQTQASHTSSSTTPIRWAKA